MCICKMVLWTNLLILFFIILITNIYVNKTASIAVTNESNATGEKNKAEIYLNNIPYQGNVEKNYTCNCTYSGKDIRKNIEDIIRSVVQDSLAITESEYYDINSDIQETAELMILQLAMSTKQIAAKVDAAVNEQNVVDAIEDIKNRVLILENTQKNAIQRVLTEPASSKMNTICDFDIPSSVQINKNMWVKYTKPPMDDLDRYMVNRTGCTYHVVDRFSMFTALRDPFDGTLFEWRGAVRARDDAIIGVYWNCTADYSFYLGYKDNTISKVYDINARTYHMQQSTPGILSPDRYVPIYIKIQSGTLSVGVDCEDKPLFTMVVSIEQGIDISLGVLSNSYYGGKWLHCPANVAVVDVELAKFLRSYDRKAARADKETD